MRETGEILRGRKFLQGKNYEGEIFTGGTVIFFREDLCGEKNFFVKGNHAGKVFYSGLQEKFSVRKFTWLENFCEGKNRTAKKFLSRRENLLRENLRYGKSRYENFIATPEIFSGRIYTAGKFFCDWEIARKKIFISGNDNYFPEKTQRVKKFAKYFTAT